MTLSQYTLLLVSIGSALGLLLATGCSDHSQFGVAQNGIREERHIPIIEKEWRIDHSNSAETYWVLACTNEHIARHSGKKVFYGNGKILREEDYYYSGVSFVPAWDPEAGQMSEMLTVAYDYTKRNNPWTCSLVNSNGINTISLSAAESELKSWGIARREKVSQKAKRGHHESQNQAKSTENLQ